MKRLISISLAICLLLAALPTLGEEFVLTGTVVTAVAKIEDAFGKADTKALSELKVGTEIVLNGGTASMLDDDGLTEGSVITITDKGVYRVTGSSENVTLVVSDEAKSGNITLILDNASMTADGTVLTVEAADKVILWVNGDCALTSGAAGDAAIVSRDDLTVAGTGTLTIVSGADGIDCKDDFRQTGAALTITAEGAGLDANDSVRIGGGTLDITSGADGIHLSNKTLDSWFYLEDGAVSIDAQQDGIDVSGEEDTFTGAVTLYGGTLTIRSGDGSAWSSDTSSKGIKCQGDIYIGGVTLTITSNDDAIHSDASVSITDGQITVSSGDDGIHADSVLSISGGTVTVAQSYEGLEAYEIDLSGGNVCVYAGDDGVNAAGGSDSSSQEANPWGRWGMMGSGTTGVLNISGGNVYINAAGDGLDSNGSIYVTGGLVIVEGPSDSGNGALDSGDSQDAVASITGGTVLALGSTGMAVNFDAGTQCSALVALSGSAGDTVTVDDGSGFSFTVSKAFSCAVYSSPALAQGQTYTISSGTDTAQMSFTSGLYYSDVNGGFGGRGGWGQPGGGQPGGWGGGRGGW